MQLESDQRKLSERKIEWIKKLRKTLEVVLCMLLSNPDRAGSLATTAAEIKSIRDMGACDTDEAFDEALDKAQMKISKKGTYVDDNL